MDTGPQPDRVPVLIVDDRVENLRALEAVLEPLGCRLVPAGSGREALKLLLDGQFAVILLDVQMPDMDGFETANLIRDRRRTRQIPIIFLSAVSTSSEHVFRGYETGAVDYIVKPIDPVALRSKVRVFVELYERGEEIRRQAETLRERDLDRARRETELRRHRRTAILDSLSLALERRTDIAGRAEQLVRSCVQTFADFALAEISTPGSVPTRALACVDPRDASELLGLARPDGRSTESGTPEHGHTHPQLTAEDWLALVPGPLGERAWDRLAPKSVVEVPLRLEGRNLGRLTLARSRADEPYGIEDLELATELAKRASMAIENSRLYELERERSRTLQLSLLGFTPLAHPAVAAATRYIAGTAGLEVGGDWFDLIERDDGKIVIIVGDVVGRGIRAATAMGKLRSAIGALAYVTDDPAAMLERLDRFAAGVSGADLATVVCAMVDPDASTVVYSSAGHLPGLVVSPGGRSAFLEDGRGFPLGIDSSAKRDQSSARIEPDSILLFFTDGIVETPRRPLGEGLDQFRAIAAEKANMDPEVVCDALIDELVDQPRDDVAIVCLRLTGRSPEFRAWRFPAEPEHLAPARHVLARWLREHAVEEQICGDLVLAFGEACANVVRHAYEKSEGGEVSAQLHYDDDILTIRVSDSGRWSTPPIVQDGGRGLTIIHQLVDASSVHGTPHGTTIIMRKHLTHEATPSPDGLATTNQPVVAQATN
jgi:serine phosphatase RsbU (regulator of sigma subunit)/CheY-like chemotaxis protein/anti-sigma regulatory factor (Ser/Thr protein kinase)